DPVQAVEDPIAAVAACDHVRRTDRMEGCAFRDAILEAGGESRGPRSVTTGAVAVVVDGVVALTEPVLRGVAEHLEVEIVAVDAGVYHEDVHAGAGAIEVVLAIARQSCRRGLDGRFALVEQIEGPVVDAVLRLRRVRRVAVDDLAVHGGEDLRGEEQGEDGEQVLLNTSPTSERG